MKFEDISDLEFETLSEKMYEDLDCVSTFIEINYEDFEQYMNERGIHRDYYCDHEIEYCESRDDKFIKFAFNYFNKEV